MEKTTTPQPTADEVPAGKIQIVDYSEKAFAVIGETKPIKDGLKNLGGKFNFRLTCGAGWIFSKTKLEAVKAFLIANKGQEQKPTEGTTGQPKKENEKTYIEIQKATEKDCNWYGLKPNSYILTIHPFQWFPSDLLCTVVNGRYEDGHNIGVTISGNLGSAGIGVVNLEAATEMLRAKGYEVRPETTLKDEVKNTVEFFAEHDIKMTGEISESTKQIADIQKVDLSGLIEEVPQHYNNLQDMEAAAQSGKVISLLNMCELVNAK